MAYTVLARRYRSTHFAGVIGQQVIAQTLSNAIKQDRVAHAYLFCGTRGVGKTSMARLFARALNAPDTIDDAPKTPDVEYPPKDVQDRMASAIMTGDDLNVIEIDAASNRRVEEARQLISGAGLSPTAQARFKIYIIDEVHMLTREAFNTLLKTMEEPPAHVKFILCTTEAHKVPPTIQSRCQRFDFCSIATPAIAEHLTSILKQEGVEAEPAVVFQIARLANGSMRDGLSLLDRLIAAGESSLTVATLEQMFGLPAADLVLGLIDAFAASDIKKALEQTYQLIAGGIGQEQLLETLIEQLRQLMLISACGVDSELVEVSSQDKDAMAQRAAKFDPPALTYMIALCENLQRQLRSSVSPRALFDAVIVRLALAGNMADITALLSQETSTPDPASPPNPETSGGAKKKATSIEPDRPIEIVVPTQAPPQVQTDDPASVLSALQQRTTGRVDFAWLQFAKITQLTSSSVTFGGKPGHEHALNYARRERVMNLVGQELTAMLGRRVRIELEEASPAALAEPTSRLAALDREALDLPLVKQVLKVFPDAIPIETRVES